ncbi:MAG: hypothetical protein FP816_01715 [Desulfobacteraceae bacterium]|nr:hypothetical protein [Desulfobacteraceae bacterium]MBU4055001.1 hypothetical protein [Pseudomonadota bacterium]
MKKIVILKGGAIESIDEYILKKCLRIMFPECDIEIQSSQPIQRPLKKSRPKTRENQMAAL